MSTIELRPVGPALCILACFAALGLMRPAVMTIPYSGAPKPAVAANDGPLAGIDVSHFQGKIDWNRTAQAGVAFAYIKATEGNHFIDPKFRQNGTGAAAAGIPFGAYHFYRPTADPATQAEHFIATAGVGAGSLPPVLDVEIAPPHDVDLAADVQIWITHVAQKTGCVPIIYTNKSLWRSHLKASFSDSAFWLADYSDTQNGPPEDLDWVIWQHTDKGAVQGISGTVDLDQFAGGSAALGEFLCK